MVAASGNRIIVAWREVKSSDASNLTNFDQQDAIRYAVCENGQWIRDEDVFGNEYVAAQTLYDGTGSTASVKGLEMAMLEDGTAAVVYTLDTNSTTENTTDWETVVAIIPAVDRTYGADDTQSEDLVRTFRLTSDNNLDENPQITTAEFGDGEERFVVAWHTERAITDDPNGETESDIRLSVMDTDGKLYENMPESLSVAGCRRCRRHNRLQLPLRKEPPGHRRPRHPVGGLCQRRDRRDHLRLPCRCGICQLH